MARTPAPPKDDKPPVDPPPDPKADDAGDDDDDLDLTRGDLEEMVAAAVAKAIAPVAPKGDDPPAPKGKRSAADDEDEMRRRVEAEVAKVREKDEIVGRLAKVEDAVKPVETAPRKPGWLERIFWS